MRASQHLLEVAILKKECKHPGHKAEAHGMAVRAGINPGQHAGN
jgi:hypothetical protein